MRGQWSGFSWISALSDADLRAFVIELDATLHRIESGELRAAALETVLHEWRESSIRPKQYAAALNASKRRTSGSARSWDALLARRQRIAAKGRFAPEDVEPDVLAAVREVRAARKKRPRSVKQRG